PRAAPPDDLIAGASPRSGGHCPATIIAPGSHPVEDAAPERRECFRARARAKSPTPVSTPAHHDDAARLLAPRDQCAFVARGATSLRRECGPLTFWRRADSEG